MASFRAPGSVEGAFALERAMDELARELGMDPLALRLKNLSKKHPSSGKPFSANHLAECYRDGAKRFGWSKRARSSRGNIRRGSGMAAQTWGGGGGPPAYATVRLNNDGTAEVFTGTQDLGTGSRTVFAQIAAEALGAKLANVRVVLGDTATLPYTGSVVGLDHRRVRGARRAHGGGGCEGAAPRGGIGNARRAREAARGEERIGASSREQARAHLSRRSAKSSAT